MNLDDKIFEDAATKDASGEKDYKSLRTTIVITLLVPLGYFVPELNFLAWIAVVYIVGIMLLINVIWFIAIDKWKQMKQQYNIGGLKLKDLGKSVLVSGSIAALLYFCGWPVAAALYAFNVASFNILYRL